MDWRRPQCAFRSSQNEKKREKENKMITIYCKRRNFCWRIIFMVKRTLTKVQPTKILYWYRISDSNYVGLHSSSKIYCRENVVTMKISVYLHQPCKSIDCSEIPGFFLSLAFCGGNFRVSSSYQHEQHVYGKTKQDHRCPSTTQGMLRVL